MRLPLGDVPTVGALFERYRSAITMRVSQGTARGYMSAWRQRVGPSFAAMPIAEVTALEIERAWGSWSGAHSTKVDALSLLSHICRVAVKGGYIAVNPCDAVELPRTQDAEPSSRALDLVEVEGLLVVIPPSGPYRRFVLALLFTGCRLGEVAGLRVSDIDWESRTILVARTASAGLHGQVVFGPTKGRKSRLVPIADQFVSVLREASEGKGAHDLLFCGPRGGVITSHNLSRALDWPRIRKQVKTFPPGEPPLRFHDLRHTAVTLMFRAGLSAPDVQAVAGHSSLQVTQRYADTRRDAARKAAEALSRHLTRIERSIAKGGEAEKLASDQVF